MTLTIQQCYNNILRDKIEIRFKHYNTYREHGLALVNAGGNNVEIANKLDYMTGSSGEFNNSLKQMGIASSMLLGGRTLYHSGEFDSVSISNVECLSIKTFLVD